MIAHQNGSADTPPVGRPRPRHRGLQLEGKILVLVTGLALLVGATALFAQRWSVERGLNALTAERPAEGGLSPEEIDRLATRSVLPIAGVVLLSTALALLLARLVVRRASRPLRELIRTADQVALGNLDPVTSAARRVNCWEVKSCGETECQAYQNIQEQCWYVDGTPCVGYEPRFPEKLEGCRRCEVYLAHRGDEIQQLGDAFQHMIGALKGSHEDLLRSDDFQKRLIRNSFNGVLATDAEDRVTIFNRAAEGMLEMSREDVIGILDWRAFLDPSLEREMDRPLSYERIRRVRGFAPRDAVIKKRDGEEIAVLLAGISLFDRGRHVGKVFFFQDVRELQDLRKELIRSERLAATGQAAAGISHSVKNILDGFRGGAYVYEQGKRRGDQEKMDKGWEMVGRNMEIISRLVMDLLSFAKEREPQLEPVDPRTLIEETLADVGIEAHARIEATVIVDAEGAAVDLDPHAFRQCLANLVRNAVEAICPERGGHICVEFRAEGGHATFEVRDDGVGMSAETMEKVKGGMFSTKGSKGTGLGLLVSEKIVLEHGGTLSMESQEGRGSTFTVEVPRCHSVEGRPPVLSS